MSTIVIVTDFVDFEGGEGGPSRKWRERKGGKVGTVIFRLD
jgi:hypothetical protein